MKKPVYPLPLFLVSAALLSLEISLMRILKVEGFGNFTYGAIALALTGFGTSGTLISLFREKVRGREEELFFWSSCGFIFFLGVGFYLSSKVVFDPLVFVWDRSQIIRLILRYTFYAVPFAAGSAAVICAFLVMKSGRAYFFNLTGSSFGIAVTILLMYSIRPERMLSVALCLGLFNLITCMIRNPGIFGRAPVPVFTIAAGLVAAGWILFFTGGIKVLPYKGEQLALNLPDARIVYSRISPYGSIDVVESRMLRIAPGLSYRFNNRLPEQHGLFIDGDLLSAVDGIQNDRLPDYLRYQVQSAAYILHRNPRVLIAGLGGGIPVERAFVNGAVQVTVCEQNPFLPDILTRVFSGFNNNFFNKKPVAFNSTDVRSFIKTGGAQFDIIDIPETAGYLQTVGGIYSADTSYLLTVEAFQDYLGGIGKDGVVSASLPLKQPPRNLLKLAATAKEALSREHLDVTENLVVLRSWQFGTLLVKKVPFTGPEIEKIKSFCSSMAFDLVFYPGMKQKEANRFTIVQDAAYYRNTGRILTEGRRFVKNYLFNIRPSTDTRPYFSYFIRPGKIPYLFRTTGKEWLFVVEGGYIVLFATFIATVILAGVFIMLPPVIMGHKIEAVKVILYFSLIAVGYMFIEILLMQKFAKFIANPLYSNSTIIAALLVFSGAGSYFSDGLEENKRRQTLLRITAFITAYFLGILFLGDRFFLLIVRASTALKLSAAVLLTAPAGFFMGIYFPVGLSALRRGPAYTLPWAWSVNGFFSVVSSTGVVLAASNAGFLATGVAAAGCYWFAVLLFFRRRMKDRTA